MNIQLFLYRYRKFVLVGMVSGYLLIGVLMYWGWSSFVQSPIFSDIQSTQKTIKSKKKALSTQMKKLNFDVKNSFARADFISSEDMVKNLRKVMRGQKGILLIDLKQMKPEVKRISEVFSSYINIQGYRGVQLYTYELKVLTNYPAFLNLLDTLQSNKKIYWKSVSYKVNQYPEAIATLKFYGIYGVKA